MRKVLFIGMILLLAMVTGAYAADFPKRDITNVVVWGAGGALFFPVSDIAYQVFVAFVLAGLCAGAITTLAVDTVSSIGFMVSALLPLIAGGGEEAENPCIAALTGAEVPAAEGETSE